METKFKLILKPLFSKRPITLGNLESVLNININGKRIFESSEEEYIKEPLIYPLKWLIRNFNQYTSERIPREVIPALQLFEEFERIQKEYYEEIKEKSGRILGYSFPRKEKEAFGNWIKSHFFNYGYLENPIIFQRRKDLMEISWRIPSNLRHQRGCEYVPLDDFKDEISRSCNQTVKLLKDSNKVSDYIAWSSELKFI